MASVITTQPIANNASENGPIEVEQDGALNPDEEQQKKKKENYESSETAEDCCCYFGEDAFILLRCISDICQCMASCTEGCFNCCSDCVQNSCEGNDGTDQDCCDCWGSSSNNGSDDCDCDCTG